MKETDEDERQKEIRENFKRDLKKLLEKYNARIDIYDVYNIYDMEDLLEMVVEFGDSNIDDINLGSSTYDSLI
jgi:DNA-binding protein Fis